MHQFSKEEMDIVKLKLVLERIFANQPRILHAFNNFLPNEYKIQNLPKIEMEDMSQSSSKKPLPSSPPEAPYEAEQVLLGCTFTAMGLGTMLFPHQLLRLSLTSLQSENVPISPDLSFVFRCFGAQATLCGAILLSCTFSKELYRNFGLAIAPFFAFDALAWHLGYLTPFGAIGDAVGNCVFTACSVWGYWKKS